MTSNDDYVLEILLQEGLVTQEQVEAVRGSILRQGTSVVDALIENKILDEAAILSVLAAQFGMEMVSLKDQQIPADVVALVPVDVARRYQIVPLAKHDDVLTVATSDPLDFNTLDSLRYVLNCNIEGVVATRAELEVAMDHYYATEASMESLLDQITDGTVDAVSYTHLTLPTN